MESNKFSGFRDFAKAVKSGDDPRLEQVSDGGFHLADDADPWEAVRLGLLTEEQARRIQIERSADSGVER